MKLLHILFLISVVLLGVAATLAYTKLSPTNELILHFTSAGEPDYVGMRTDVLGAIMAAGVLILMNYCISLVLRTRERFFATVLMTASPAISLLLLIAVSVIVANNQ